MTLFCFDFRSLNFLIYFDKENEMKENLTKEIVFLTVKAAIVYQSVFYTFFNFLIMTSYLSRCVSISKGSPSISIEP